MENVEALCCAVVSTSALLKQVMGLLQYLSLIYYSFIIIWNHHHTHTDFVSDRPNLTVGDMVSGYKGIEWIISTLFTGAAVPYL